MATGRSELRVFVDANILIAGSVWPRRPYEVLQHALRNEYILVLNGYVIEQARRTLAKRFPHEMHRFDAFLLTCDYEEAGTPSVEAMNANAYLVRDITDVPVALAAIEAGADCLVSEDKDLTARDESTAELRRRLPVYLSGTFLREI